MARRGLAGLAGALIGALAAASLAPAGMAAPKLPIAAFVADQALLAYAGACANNLGRMADQERVLAVAGYQPAAAGLAAAMPHEAGERIWMHPEPAVGVAVLTRPGGLTCRVMTRQADLARLKAGFAKNVEAITGPGLAITRLQQTPAPAADKPLEVLAYRMTITPNRTGEPDRLYSLASDPDPAAYVDAILVNTVIARETGF